MEVVANMRPYMVREPMRPEHLFLIEASAAAMEAGLLRTVAVAIERVLDSFTGGTEREWVGFGGVRWGATRSTTWAAVMTQPCYHRWQLCRVLAHFARARHSSFGQALTEVVMDNSHALG